MINLQAIKEASKKWEDNKPFPHCIVDGFFDIRTAKSLEKEFPAFNDNIWHEYGNAIEVKKVCNNWNAFPRKTYEIFSLLNSGKFLNFLSEALLINSDLYSDPGLNGGGWHIHSRGGKLNTHLDYSLHPKLNLQRKLNIIIYLNSEWKSSWGGQLGFWGNESAEFPGNLITEIQPNFNRAVIFDTTKNSWHGLPTPLRCPDNQFRKSLAVYYLTDPKGNVNRRSKALFAPTKEQQDDSNVLELIKKRSQLETASDVYTDKN